MPISSLIVMKLTSQRGHWAHTCEPDVSSPWPQTEASPQAHSDIIQWCHKYDITVNLWWGFNLRSWWAHTRLTVWYHRLTSVSSQWPRGDVNFITGILPPPLPRSFLTALLSVSLHEDHKEVREVVVVCAVILPSRTRELSFLDSEAASHGGSGLRTGTESCDPVLNVPSAGGIITASVET